MTAPKLAFSVREAAAATGISVAGIRRLIEAGELRAVKPNGCKQIIAAKHLTAYLDGLEQQVAS